MTSMRNPIAKALRMLPHLKPRVIPSAKGKPHKQRKKFLHEQDSDK